MASLLCSPPWVNSPNGLSSKYSQLPHFLFVMKSSTNRFIPLIPQELFQSSLQDLHGGQIHVAKFSGNVLSLSYLISQKLSTRLTTPH